MTLINRLSNWHDAKSGLAAFAVIELALSYGFASWAIDSGRLLAWFLAIVLFVGGVQNLIKCAWKAAHHA
jgi:hypothetical protein